MKKILSRLSVLAFTIFFASYSLLYAFCVPVYASALPELPPDFIDNFTVINGSPSSSGSYSGLYSIAFEAALMKMAEPGGAYDGLVAHEELALKMASDFVNEYGDDAFRIAVAQPADAVKQIFWDYPNQAVGACLDACDAGMLVVADDYVALSDSLVGNIKKFLGDHIKHNVYFSDVPDHFSGIYKKPNPNGTFVAGWTSVPQSRWLGPDSCNGRYFIILNRTEVNDPNGFWILNHSIDSSIGNWSLVASSAFNSYEGFFTDMPIFSSYPDLSKSEWWKDAENYIEIEPNIVTPVTNPIPLECPDIYSIPELSTYIETIPAPSLDPNTDPETDPDGYPMPNPEPITIPAPAPVPVPEPYPNPDPNPDPNPNPNPDPNPDPNPNPNPDPDPDNPDPDPDDPDPDPDDPDPDPDPKFEWPDNSGGNPLMDLSEFFPFCLPMDIYLALHMLSADNAEEYYSYAASIDGNVEETDNPVDNPVVFDIPMTFHLSGVNQQDYTENFVIDIIQPAGEGSGSAEPYVKYLRYFLVFIYIMFLIFVSVKITPH